jgi:hypothetical protein
MNCHRMPCESFCSNKDALTALFTARYGRYRRVSLEVMYTVQPLPKITMLPHIAICKMVLILIWIV